MTGQSSSRIAKSVVCLAAAAAVFCAENACAIQSSAQVAADIDTVPLLKTKKSSGSSSTRSTSTSASGESRRSRSVTKMIGDKLYDAKNWYIKWLIWSAIDPAHNFKNWYAAAARIPDLPAKEISAKMARPCFGGYGNAYEARMERLSQLNSYGAAVQYEENASQFEYFVQAQQAMIAKIKELNPDFAHDEDNFLHTAEDYCRTLDRIEDALIKYDLRVLSKEIDAKEMEHYLDDAFELLSLYKQMDLEKVPKTYKALRKVYEELDSKPVELSQFEPSGTIYEY